MVFTLYLERKFIHISHKKLRNSVTSGFKLNSFQHIHLWTDFNKIFCPFFSINFDQISKFIYLHFCRYYYNYYWLLCTFLSYFFHNFDLYIFFCKLKMWRYLVNNYCKILFTRGCMLLCIKQRYVHKYTINNSSIVTFFTAYIFDIEINK